MRDVNFGWLIRYMHSTGASLFFVVVYLHMMRGIMYGSYKKPRELLWIFGMLIYLVHGVLATLGSNVFLGCAGNHLVVWSFPYYW